MNHPVIMTEDFSYEPSNVAIAAGDTITWENQSEHPHSATAPDGSHFVERLEPGEISDPVAFETPGAIHYHCRFHGGMEGDITVA